MSSFGGQAVRFRRWGRCVFGGGGQAGAVSAVGALRVRRRRPGPCVFSGGGAACQVEVFSFSEVRVSLERQGGL